MHTSEKGLGRFVDPLRPRSIRGKILALAVVATLVPALSTAGLSYVRTRTALTETLEGELRGIGTQTARELDLWIKERFYDLRVFVGSFEVTENLDRIGQGGAGSTEAVTRLRDYLTVVQERFPEYAGLVVLDQEARTVAAGEASVPYPALPDDWLDALALGETRLGEPYWQDSLSTVAATTAVPIHAADGRFLGALVATLTFEPLGEILGALTPGRAGDIEVLSSDGRVIVATRAVDGFEVALPREALEALAAAEGTTEYQTAEGVEMVGTLTAVQPTGWAVLAQLPSQDAYAPVSELTTSTLILVAGLLLVVGTIAYLIGRIVTRPLATLAEGAGRVAEGDLSVDLPVTGRDEVAYLTGVFNGMVARLRANAEKLDEAHSVLQEQNRELERMSMTDALTSLFNRRHVMDVLEKEVHRAERHERTLSVLMMDIDRFKEYNDTFGHQAGDDVLAGMGEVLRDATREADVPARYGGEEFIVVLPDCEIQGAVDAAERIRRRLAREVFEGGKVTVSIGAAEYPTHGASPMELIGAADTALYDAKAAGRDRVERAPGGKKVRRVPDGKKRRRKNAESAD